MLKQKISLLSLILLSACSHTQLDERAPMEMDDTPGRLAQQEAPVNTAGVDSARAPAGVLTGVFNKSSDSEVTGVDLSSRWPLTLFDQAERKYRDAASIKLPTLSGLSFTMTGQISEDEFHFVDSGLGTPLSFDGKDSIKAKFGSEAPRIAGTDEKGSIYFKHGDADGSVECRSLTRTPLFQVICLQSGTASGARYLLFKQSTFLRKIPSSEEE